MAASTLVVLPAILLFFLAQKTFIEGIATTGTKG
jgi:ABC-type glycerol-3-phosphate transport system permease component